MFIKVKNAGYIIVLVDFLPFLAYNNNVDGRLIEDNEKGRTAILPFSHLETMNVYIEVT